MLHRQARWGPGKGTRPACTESSVTGAQICDRREEEGRIVYTGDQEVNASFLEVAEQRKAFLEPDQESITAETMPCPISEVQTTKELLTPCTEPAPEPASGKMEEPFDLSAETAETAATAETTSAVDSAGGSLGPKVKEDEQLESKESPDVAKLLAHLMDDHSEEQVPDCIFWQKGQKGSKRSILI